jgi:hypothetical protein
VEDFGAKVLLLFIGAIATLIVNEVRKQLGREDHVLTWSLVEDHLVVARQALPSAVRKFLPRHETMNVSKFVLTARNTGKKAIEDVVVLVVRPAETQLLMVSSATKPPRGVPFEDDPSDKRDEFGYKVSLRPGQEFIVEFYLQSEASPTAAVYWRGGEDDQEFRMTEAQVGDSAEHHFVSRIRNVVIALAVPPAFNGVALVLGASAQSAFVFSDSAPLFASGSGVMLAALVQLYFYLRAVPHALALFRLLTSRGRRYPVSGDYAVMIVDSSVHLDGGTIGGLVTPRLPKADQTVPVDVEMIGQGNHADESSPPAT